MKKVYLFIVFCICMTTSMFGQLKIDATGYATSSNVTIDGFIGAGGMTTTGVLTVKSNRVDPHYNSYYTIPVLICAQSQGNVYPFANVYNRLINFYVTHDGQVYTKSGLVTTSDSLCKENISELQPTMNKIRSLHGVSFNYKDESQNDRQRSVSAINGEDEVQLGATPEISRKITEEKNRKRIGLIAQDVEKVFPEAVRTSYDGTKGILYDDLIGVLVEGMKELQDSLATQAANLNSRIALLEQQLAMLTSFGQQSTPKKGQSSGNNAAQGMGQAELYQNTPNPFNRETEISYRLSGNVVSASICIYNLNGQQLKKYAVPVDSVGGKVILSASEFTPGIYIYSLVINNQMIDSKRMTLTD